MQSWLERRNWVGKCAQARGMTASLRILSSKANSNTWRASQGVNWSWSQCIKSHHAQTSSGKGLPSHFWNRNIVRSILPGKKRTGLLLSGPKSSFQMKVNFAFHLEIKVWSLEEEWRGTESMLLQVQCEVSTVSDDLGCHVICWCWSIVFFEVHSQRSHLPGYFRALHASICWQALWRCWFHFPKLPIYTKSWFNDHGAWLASKLAWPEPHRESMGYCQEEDERHQTQQCRWPEGRYQINLGFITPEQCHRLIASMPRRIDAVIHAKGGPTKYWVHRN